LSRDEHRARATSLLFLPCSCINQKTHDRKLDVRFQLWASPKAITLSQVLSLRGGLRAGWTHPSRSPEERPVSLAQGRKLPTTRLLTQLNNPSPARWV